MYTHVLYLYLHIGKIEYTVESGWVFNEHAGIDPAKLAKKLAKQLNQVIQLHSEKMREKQIKVQLERLLIWEIVLQ